MNLKNILALVFICFCCSFVQAQTYKLKSDANLRSAPGTDASIVSVLKEGQTVTVVEKTNDNWYKVEVDGKKGYVSSSVLKRKDSQKNNDNSGDNSNSSTKKSRKEKDNSSSSNSSLPDLAIGIRLGTPTALSVKKYYGTSAVEFVLGTFPNLYTKHDYNFYNKRFNNYYYKNKNYYYNYIDNRGSLLLGLNISKQKESSKIKGLYVYGAGGLSAIFNKYEFGYYNNQYGYVEDAQWFVDYGLNALIGVEYHMKDVPVSVFLDLGAYIEFYHEPGIVLPLGSIGARYNFE